MKTTRQRLRDSPWFQASLAIVSAILGLFAEPLLGAIAPPLFRPANLPYIAFIVVAALFMVNTLYSAIFWQSTGKRVDQVADCIVDLDAAVGQSARLVPYEQGYVELEERIRTARKEILVLTVIVFDWEKGQPVWDLERQNSPSRKSFYSTLRKKLITERGTNDFRFVQIVQIPERHRLEEMLAHDTVYAENCQFLATAGQIEPEFACLRAVRTTFSNSVILIDQAFAHISFDVRRPGGGEIDAPFVMLIDDPNSTGLGNFLKLCKRVEAESVLITRLDI